MNLAIITSSLYVITSATVPFQIEPHTGMYFCVSCRLKSPGNPIRKTRPTLLYLDTGCASGCVTFKGSDWWVGGGVGGGGDDSE